MNWIKTQQKQQCPITTTMVMRPGTQLEEKERNRKPKNDNNQQQSHIAQQEETTDNSVNTQKQSGNRTSTKSYKKHRMAR